MNKYLLLFLLASLAFPYTPDKSPVIKPARHTTSDSPKPDQIHHLQADIISYDTSFLDTLANLGDQLVYDFTGSEGDVITVRVNTWDGFVHPVVAVKNDNSSILSENTASSYNSSARIDTLRLHSDGLYSITVNDRDRDETGVVGISLQRIAPASDPNIFWEEVNEYAFNSTGQIHLLSFAGHEGEVITIRANNKTKFIRPRLELYAPNGEYLNNENASSYASPARIDTFRLPETGTYSLLLMDVRGSEIGNMFVTIQRLSPPYQPATISYNQHIPLEIAANTTLSALTLESQKDDIYSFRLNTRSGFVEPTIEFYSPLGQSIAKETASSYNSPARLTSMPLEHDGLHTLLLFDDEGTETGSLGLSVQRLFPNSHLTPFGDETIVHDRLYIEGQMNMYTFLGLAKEDVDITMVRDSGFVRSRLELFDPDGNLMMTHTASNYTQPAEINIKLDKKGIYGILAMDESGTELGTYTLQVDGIGSAVTYVLDTTICPNDSIIVNEKTYNRDRLNGVETFTEAGSNDRDSIVIVQLDTFETAVGQYSPLVCLEDVVKVGEESFNISTRRTGRVTLENNSINGCDSIVEVSLQLGTNCQPQQGIPLFIPDAFTPNGDGFNDRLIINGLIDNDRYRNHELTILDRYRRLVFQASPYDNQWMGVDMNGEPLPAGTYFLILDLKDAKQETKIQNLTILR